MKRDVIRSLARERWPVVMDDTGSGSEIVYPYIRELKAIYASPDELRRGFPMERLAVVLGDRSGHSFTEASALQLRLPTSEQAVNYCLDRRAESVQKMLVGIDRLREMEGF